MFVQLYHISEAGGGAEVQANYLAKELVSRGFDVNYICQTHNKSFENQISVIDSVKIHWIKKRSAHTNTSLNDVYNKIVEIEPDIIIERMSSSFGWPILKVKKKYNVKYIWICTDNTSPVKFKTVKKFFKEKPFIKFLYAFKGAIKTDVIRFYANKKADIVFTQNNTQSKLLKKNFNKDSFKMISGHPFPKTSISVDSRFKKKTILWCGNLGQYKRPELFLELAKSMPNIKFIMVGGHDDKAYLDDLFENKPCNLMTTGRLNFDEALSFFDEATILINTSISEGFSNTYIQAWLRGIPTLVFGADPDDVIKNNDLGANVKTIEKAKSEIENLFSNFESYRNIANNTLNYSNRNHSIKFMTDNFLSHLNINKENEKS